MVQLRKFGTGKKIRKNAAKWPEKYNCWDIPYPELTLDDMTEFKNRLYKAITTNQVFMEYNGRKYCKEYAKLAIRVTENTRANRVIYDA